MFGSTSRFECTSILFDFSLSVRRSSIVEKHKISQNDAKQEGIFRQNPEFLHVVIKTVCIIHIQAQTIRTFLD